MRAVAANDELIYFTRQRMQSVELFGGKSAAIRSTESKTALYSKSIYRLFELSGLNPPEFYL